MVLRATGRRGSTHRGGKNLSKTMSLTYFTESFPQAESFHRLMDLHLQAKTTFSEIRSYPAGRWTHLAKPRLSSCDGRKRMRSGVEPQEPSRSTSLQWNSSRTGGHFHPFPICFQDLTSQPSWAGQWIKTSSWHPGRLTMSGI